MAHRRTKKDDTFINSIGLSVPDNELEEIVDDAFETGKKYLSQGEEDGWKLVKTAKIDGIV